jgi:carbonic anhydrase
MRGQNPMNQTSAWLLGIVVSGGLYSGLYGFLKTYAPKPKANHGSEAKSDASGHGSEGSSSGNSQGEENHGAAADGSKSGAGDSHSNADAAKDSHAKSEHDDIPSVDKKTLHEAEIAQLEKAKAGSKDEHSKSPHWTYEGRLGPKAWGQLSDDFIKCEKGTKQSPIDLVDSKVDSRLQPIEFHYEPQDIALENNGHTLIAKFSDPTNYVKHGEDKYNLLQFHFHTPSEHFVDGAPYDMEVHLVHQNSGGKLLVVGILMEALGKGNSAVESLWRDLPVSSGGRGPTLRFNPDQLLPKKREYWNYDGSLTTPPCSEDVRWYVMSKPIEMSVRQVDQFQASYRKNARPPQPLHSRRILKSRDY